MSVLVKDIIELLGKTCAGFPSVSSPSFSLSSLILNTVPPPYLQSLVFLFQYSPGDVTLSFICVWVTPNFFFSWAQVLNIRSVLGITASGGSRIELSLQSSPPQWQSFKKLSPESLESSWFLSWFASHSSFRISALHITSSWSHHLCVRWNCASSLLLTGPLLPLRNQSGASDTWIIMLFSDRCLP